MREVILEETLELNIDLVEFFLSTDMGLLIPTCQPIPTSGIYPIANQLNMKS